MCSRSHFTPAGFKTQMMTPDQERWAEALAVHRMYGEDACTFVALSIGVAAELGDQDRVDRWMAIARRLDQLLAGALQ